jgi:hypothetical protein
MEGVGKNVRLPSVLRNPSCISHGSWLPRAVRIYRLLPSPTTHDCIVLVVLFDRAARALMSLPTDDLAHFSHPPGLGPHRRGCSLPAQGRRGGDRRGATDLEVLRGGELDIGLQAEQEQAKRPPPRRMPTAGACASSISTPPWGPRPPQLASAMAHPRPQLAWR